MVDLTGKQFGRWLVISYAYSERTPEYSRHYWHCICECGEERNVLAFSLTSGKSKSCGCDSLKGDGFSFDSVVRAADSIYSLLGAPARRDVHDIISGLGNDDRSKHSAANHRGSRRCPECVAEAVAVVVFDYLNGGDSTWLHVR